MKSMGFDIKNGILKKYTEEPAITDIVVPDNVTSIEDNAFRDCTSLRSVIIPDSVTKIGNYAFAGCTALSDVKISNADIVGNAFWGDTALKKLPAFGYFVNGKQCKWFSFDFGFGSYNDTFIKHMLDTADYDDEYIYWDDNLETKVCPIDLKTKYQFVSQVFLKDKQKQAKTYIKKNISDIMCYFIDIDDYETVKGLLESGKFVKKKNIMKFIDHAVEHTKNGGDIQIQVLLMNYKNDKFPDMNPLKDIKF